MGVDNQEVGNKKWESGNRKQETRARTAQSHPPLLHSSTLVLKSCVIPILQKKKNPRWSNVFSVPDRYQTDP